jgi:UDP-N-acetylmuramoyl-tripeptide--D-alanyl-D-alanine ligase
MELGADSVYEHQQIVNLLQQFNWQAVILVGGDFKHVNHPYLYLEDPIAAADTDWFKNQHLNNTYVLIKGSRSMQMEKLLNK